VYRGLKSRRTYEREIVSTRFRLARRQTPNRRTTDYSVVGRWYENTGVRLRAFLEEL
jgi:hypothetical protein